MIDVRQKRILNLAVQAGQILMKSGAEVHRVEDTIQRICVVCGIPSVEVFATPTGIFVSLDPGEDDSDVLTHINRIHSTETDLKKISDVNQFSHTFTTTDMSIEEGLAELSRIDGQRKRRLPWRLIGAGLVAGFFCALLSGNLVDSLCSGVIGILAYGGRRFLQHYDINYFIQGFCCCVLASFLALLSVSLGLGTSPSSMIIGSLMLFVPGAAITNAIRDFLYGDMLAGVARMTEAMVIAVSLATGVGVVLKLWSASGMAIKEAAPSDSIVLPLLLGFAATLGFTLIFRVPRRSMLIAALIGGVGWMCYQWLDDFGAIFAGFLAAFVVGLLSDLAARIFKEASTVFIIPGIMPLVPGAGMYYTVMTLLTGELEHAAILGIETLFMAGAIAIGLLTISALIRIILSIGGRIRHLTR